MILRTHNAAYIASFPELDLQSMKVGMVAAVDVVVQNFMLVHPAGLEAGKSSVDLLLPEFLDPIALEYFFERVLVNVSHDPRLVVAAGVHVGPRRDDHTFVHPTATLAA